MNIKVLILISTLFMNSCSSDGDKEQVTSEAKIGITDAQTNFTITLGEEVKLEPVISAKNTTVTYSWSMEGNDLGTGKTLVFSSTEDSKGTNKIKFTVVGEEGLKETLDYTINVLNNDIYKRIGYWLVEGGDEPTDDQLDKLTHIVCSFLEVSPDGNLTSTAIDAKLDGIIQRAHAKGVYVMLAVGGASNIEFSDCIVNAASRNTLVERLVAYSENNDIDGIDLDYESWTGGNHADDLEKSKGLLELMKSLKNDLPENDLLAMPVMTSDWVNYNYTVEMYQYLDWIGLMTYDNTATWEDSPYGNHASYEDYVAFIDLWITQKALPTDKLVTGLPFYGYTFENENVGGLGEYFSYKSFLSEHPDANTKDNIGTSFYNGQPTILKKAQYVKDNNYAGILIWEVTQDINSTEGKSLLKSIHSVLNE